MWINSMGAAAEQVWPWFEKQSPLSQALIAGVLTWLITAAGAAVVFCTSRINQKLLDSMFGFAAGVMMAASYWSLLAPALEIARDQGRTAWLPVACAKSHGPSARLLHIQSLSVASRSDSIGMKRSQKRRGKSVLCEA